MKRSLLISFCVVFCSSIALAQPNLGSIDVFSDPGYADCNFIDAGGPITAYVLVTHSVDGTTGATWMMDIPSAWIFLGQTSPFVNIFGDALNGITIGYAQCLTGNFLILTVSFIGDGLSPTCSHISIVPNPATSSGLIEIVDCQLPFPLKHVFDQLGQGIVNGNGSCNCNVPIQQTTWGQIKSLYQ